LTADWRVDYPEGMKTRAWIGLYLSLGLLGCTSTESRCETLCDWSEKCSTDETSCSVNQCVDEYDDSSDDCQDAFDDFADCVDDEDLSCSGVESQCLGEAVEFIEQCG
jgi:hypothetical protein